MGEFCATLATSGAAVHPRTDIEAACIHVIQQNKSDGEHCATLATNMGIDMEAACLHALQMADILRADLWQAAAEGEVRTVAAWLHMGGAMDGRCAERSDGTLLMAAASRGQEALVRILLQRGTSVNLQDSHGNTALHSAALRRRSASVVRALLEAKANTSLQNVSGKTALMLAEQEKS